MEPMIMRPSLEEPIFETTREEPLAALHSAGVFTKPISNGHWPSDIETEQLAAWETFLSTPPPKLTDEAWRFSKINALDISEFHLRAGIANESRLANDSNGLDQFAAKFVIANNRMIARELLDLPEGVVAISLEEAAHTHGEIFRKYFLQQPVELGAHKYAKLHQSQLRTGLLLYVPPGITIPNPIEVHYWAEGENIAVFPHTLIILGENSQATVIEHFRSADGKKAFVCGISDLHLSAGAQLHHITLQDWSDTTLAFALNSTVVGENASATALCMNFGGYFVRNESRSEMVARGAHSVMLSLNPATGNRIIDQRTLQLHNAPGATSDLLYHNALDHHARTIFAGLIKVAPGAHQTDAYQKVRNLLLSDDAEAYSMPGLEILADDVRCSHGATSGELNDEELFYLQARGIPKEMGRRMIVLAFFESLLERIEDIAIRTYLSTQIRNHIQLSSLSD